MRIIKSKKTLTLFLMATFLMSVYFLFYYNNKDLKPMSNEMDVSHGNSYLPKVINKNTVLVKGVKKKSHKFPEWHEVYLGTGRSIYSVNASLDLSEEVEAGNLGRLIFKEFYSLKEKERTRSNFILIMSKNGWRSDVKNRHKWLNYNNFNTSNYSNSYLFKLKQNKKISMKTAELELESAMLDVGLAGIDLPENISSSPEKIIEVCWFLRTMNDSLEGITGFTGGVLGLNGRVFLKWGHKGQIGYFTVRRDGVFEIYVDADRFAHEWMHAYINILEGSFNSIEKNKSNKFYQDWSDKFSIDSKSNGYKSFNKLIQSSNKISYINKFNNGMDLIGVNQAKLKCWDCAALNAKHLKTDGLIKRRSALANAASRNNESGDTIDYIMNSKELVAEMFRDTVALRTDKRIMSDGSGQSYLFNLSRDEASLMQPNFRNFFAETRGFVWDSTAEDYANQSDKIKKYETKINYKKL